MFDAWSEDEDIAGCQRILAIQCLEDEVAFENMNCHRARGCVSRQISAGTNGHHRQAEGTFLHQRAGGASVAGKNVLVYHPLVVSKVIDENLSFDCPVH